MTIVRRKLALDQSGTSLVLVDSFQAAEKQPNLSSQSCGEPPCEPASESLRTFWSALALRWPVRPAACLWPHWSAPASRCSPRRPSCCFMMLGGAIGFYLGIDTPPLPFHADRQPPDGHWVGKIDTPELLSAVGTFLAAGTAFASRRRDRAAARSAHRLDLDDHDGMGLGRHHADRRRRDRAPAPMR